MCAPDVGQKLLALLLSLGGSENLLVSPLARCVEAVNKKDFLVLCLCAQQQEELSSQASSHGAVEFTFSLPSLDIDRA